MYNNYTPLQQRQLALQEYSNTQSTYLLVCASARSTALKATLTDQLHRKFRLVDRLGGELTASVDGVLLAAEDVELMSTALMYFAKALQDGRGLCRLQCCVRLWRGDCPLSEPAAAGAEPLRRGQPHPAGALPRRRP